MRHCCYFREKWGIEGMTALPKVKQENLGVEQEIEAVPIVAFARPWTRAGSVPGAAQLLPVS